MCTHWIDNHSHEHKNTHLERHSNTFFSASRQVGPQTEWIPLANLLCAAQDNLHEEKLEHRYQTNWMRFYFETIIFCEDSVIQKLLGAHFQINHSDSEWDKVVTQAADRLLKDMWMFSHPSTNTVVWTVQEDNLSTVSDKKKLSEKQRKRQTGHQINV